MLFYKISGSIHTWLFVKWSTLSRKALYIQTGGVLYVMKARSRISQSFTTFLSKPLLEKYAHYPMSSGLYKHFTTQRNYLSLNN